MSQEAGWSGRDDARAGTAWREVLAGLLIVALEHALVGGLLGGGGYLATAAVAGNGELLAPFFVWGFAIGVAQLGYIVPTVLIAVFVRRRVAAGVLLGALATFLLNGACAGLFCAGLA